MNLATIQPHDVPTFADIDRCLTNLGVLETSPATGWKDAVQKVIAMFALLRPLLVAISSLPIIPISWRTAMHLFVAALDALAARGAAGDFKAGKDL